MTYAVPVIVCIACMAFGCWIGRWGHAEPARRDHGMMAAGKPRSGKWPRVRDEYLRLHPYCEVCGTKHPDVHHVESYSRRPDLELEPSNLISLGRDCGCHELFGHLKRWESENTNCRRDVTEWHAKIQDRP